MKAEAMLAMGCLVSACASAPRAAPDEFEGEYAHGFEVDSFTPCGTTEKWWTLLPPGAQERYNAIAKPYHPVYLRVVGDTSARGQHGHLGGYSRYLTVKEVIAMAPLDSLKCGR